MLVLTVDFTDSPAPAAPPGGWTNVLEQVNQFYLRQSYHQSWISSYAISPVIHLGVSWTNYIPYSNWKISSFLPDIRAQAKLAGYDSDDFDLEVFHLRLTNEAPVGTAVHGGKGCWLNFTNGYPRFAMATAHELGHNFGLFHTRGFSAANYAVFPIPKYGFLWEEYGGMFDTMGVGTADMQADFCVYNKNLLGWIPDPLIHRPTTSGVYRLHAFDQNVLSPGLWYGMKIVRDPNNDYWFEFRQAFTNNPWSRHGLLVYWGGDAAPISVGGPMLLDMTPGSRGLDDLEPGRNLATTMHDAPLALGRTYSDPAVNLHITPLRKGGTTPESLDVAVHFGPFPTNQPPAVTMIATNLAPSTNQLVHFAVNATDPDGDPLAYYWEFDDPGAAFGAGLTPFGAGAPPADALLATVAGQAWASSGVFQVRCTVSDLKGGQTTAAALVTVGSGGGLTITGTIKDEAGQPIAGAIVSNWKNTAPNAVTIGSTNLIVSATTASNGQYILRVKPNSTNLLRAHANGRLFTCNTPGGSTTGRVIVTTTSSNNVDFTRTTNLWTVSGSVVLAGISGTYQPTLHGDITVHDACSGKSTNVTTNGTWQMTVPDGPVALSFLAPTNYDLRYSFPNPYDVNDHFNLFTFFVNVPGAVSHEGFGTAFASGDGSPGAINIPVVLTLPAGYTNATWPPIVWIGAAVEASSTATYGLDYRLNGMEINFTNYTAVFTNHIALQLRPSPATNSRTIVLRLEAFNSGAHLGGIQTHTYAIIPPGADADGDGLPDWWEWRFSQGFTNLAPDQDDDADQVLNRDEFAADTEPDNAASKLSIRDLRFLPGGVQLHWAGGTQSVQFVESRTDLLNPAEPWAALFTNLPPTAAAPSLLLPAATTTSAHFRIRAQR